MSNQKITIYDTTLRDGSQAEGVSFTVSAKLRVAEKLDQFGIDYIEGGWPGSNPRDMAFFEKAVDLELKHSKIAAFGSTRRASSPVEEDPQIKLLLDASTPVVTIFGKSWLLHVTDVLRTTPEENLAMIEDSVVETELMSIRDPAGALVSACLMDVLSTGLSAVYSYFEPDAERRSLGTFSILRLVEEARSRSLQYVYLGYWIEDCAKMTYKSRFQSIELLGTKGWSDTPLPGAATPR